ncbi:MAG: hypothetical protein ABFC98_08445 [Candidatus Cloacimonas sp.]
MDCIKKVIGIYEECSTAKVIVRLLNFNNIIKKALYIVLGAKKFQ